MRILVADKDPWIQSLIATRLQARHYEVKAATRSEEALRLLERFPADLILISTQMERVGSKYLIEKIRQNVHWASLPIILLAEEEQLAALVMTKERGFDDFLVKPFNAFILQLRVALNITRARQRVEVNALTHLPGNHSIERVIHERIASGEKFSVLYMDVNHFKSFNDRYGFEKGDDVIRQTAKILIRTCEKIAPEGDAFVGHIGGDDFVVVITPEREEAFARAFIDEFDRLIPTYYSEADIKRGSIKVKNRQGKMSTFPLMSCSVAACNNLYRDYKNLGEIAQDAAEVKSFLKSQPGSHYLRDRRSSPMSELEEAAKVFTAQVPKAKVKSKKEKMKVDPLGQVLLGAGLISHEQLSLALKRHLETGRRLGQVLIGMNAIRSQDVGHMLEKKLNVPYVSLKKFAPPREVMRLFSDDFMETHRVVPLEIAGDAVKLAMCDPFDLKTLDAIERITAFKPVPCLALEDEFEQFLESYLRDKNLEQKTG